MDALASLAFGIIVVQVIRDLGVDDPTAVAGSTVRAGIFSSLLMAIIYIAVTIAGTQSRGVLEASENGGTALAQIAQHYLGSAGLFILAATVTLACLKTAVGLITSCAETFSALFPDGPKYRIWAIIFSLVSLLFANLGLSAIISYSLPVLMFLYPLSIALIALALLGKFFGHDRTVYCWTIGFTLIAAVYDLTPSTVRPSRRSVSSTYRLPTSASAGSARRLSARPSALFCTSCAGTGSRREPLTSQKSVRSMTGRISFIYRVFSPLTASRQTSSPRRGRL